MVEEHTVSLFWKLCLANCLAIISILALAMVAEARELEIPDEIQGGINLSHETSVMSGVRSQESLDT